MEAVSAKRQTGWPRGTLRHAAALWCAIHMPLLAQAPGAPGGYQVKAAFLLNFTKFVEWPPAAFADSTAPLTICILGNDPFGAVLDQLVAGEAVNGHMLAVQRVGRNFGTKTCQVLYAGEGEPNVRALLERLQTGVLTVGEGDGFLREGGIIAFVIQDRHVRFDINQQAAIRASLDISARLLRVARSVQR